MKIITARKNVVYLSLLAAIYTSQASASGFYLPLSSTSDLGLAFAGSAADAAQDASTMYTNPAGLSLLQHQQLLISGIAVANHVEFNGTAVNRGFSETDKATTNGFGVIPALYYAMPINNKFTFGFSVTSPYGLGDYYPRTSVLRYNVTTAKASSADISPNLAYKLSDKLSIGLGLDALYLKAEQESMVRTEPLTAEDSMLTNNMSGWGYGWHAGALYQVTPKTRVGLNYRSSVSVHLDGTSKFYIGGGVNGVNVSDDLETSTRLPAITTLSAYHDITSAWAVMGTVEYFQWNSIKNDHLFNVALVNSTTDVTVPKNFHNTWHYAIGTSYQISPKWLMRMGADYDQTPTNDTDREAVMPDSDRYGVAIGTHYQFTKAVGVDAAYYHAFYEGTKINNTNSAAGSSLQGNVRSYGDLVGLQLAWNIS